jgi:hypothetical protein
MKIIEKSESEYILFEENNKIYFDVNCGTIASFGVTVEISKETIEEIKKDPSFLKNLAAEMRYDPEKYIKLKKV